MSGVWLYLAGMASIPSAVLAWWLILRLLQWTSKGAELVLARVPHLPRNRVLAAATVFGGKRVWVLSAWEVGVVVLVGQEYAQRDRAVEALELMTDRGADQ